MRAVYYMQHASRFMHGVEECHVFIVASHVLLRVRHEFDRPLCTVHDAAPPPCVGFRSFSGEPGRAAVADLSFRSVLRK